MEIIFCSWYHLGWQEGRGGRRGGREGRRRGRREGAEKEQGGESPKLTALTSSNKSRPWYFNPPNCCSVLTCSLVKSAWETTSFMGELRATFSAASSSDCWRQWGAYGTCVCVCVCICVECVHVLCVCVVGGWVRLSWGVGRWAKPSRSLSGTCNPPSPLPRNPKQPQIWLPWEQSQLPVTV